VRASVDDTIDILRGLKDRYEGSHRAKITEEALIAVAEPSDRYVTDRFLPDKAIEFMDQVSSRGLPPSAVWKGFEVRESRRSGEPASGPRTLSEATEAPARRLRYRELLGHPDRAATGGVRFGLA